MTISRKVGLHIIGGTSVPLGHPAMVKLVDCSPEYVAQVRKQMKPDTLIVVRWVEAEQPLDDPERNAQSWFDRRYWVMERMWPAKPIAFEGYNEVADMQAEAYCRFEVERLRLMVGNAAVGNFSVGTPDLPIWETYRPMLDMMGESDYLGLHEYWSHQPDLVNPYHVRRFRMAPELTGKRLVITECGRDVVEGHGRPGWKLTCSADEYLMDLRKLGELYDECPQVLGACVFTVGGKWGDFDVTDIWPRVVAEYETLQPSPVRWAVEMQDTFDNGQRRVTIERKV